jgi:DNA-binding response OmpR family regulator
MAKTILVIDDNNDLRENTAEILDLAGYKTLTAENGKRGVEVATREKPDVIVCDIMMPELDGYGVLHLLRKNADTQNIPFIFLTAKTERSDFRKGMEMGADDYVTKPFEDIELLNAIEVRLKKAEVLQQNYSSTPQGLAQFVKDVKDTGLLKHLSDQYAVENFNKKQTLYQEGKRPRFLYYLVSGKVKALKAMKMEKNTSPIFSAPATLLATRHSLKTKITTTALPFLKMRRSCRFRGMSSWA